MVVEILEQIETSDRILQPGQLADIPDEVVCQLGGKVRPLTPLRKEPDAQRVTHLQKQSSDWVTFCMAHENTYPDSHCPVKHDRYDPFTHCKGWQIKTGKVTLNRHQTGKLEAHY
jgi:hypothetical protein